MLQGSEAIAADPIFANAAEKVIPAPEVYSDWFTQVDDQRRKLAVGARRFAVVQDRVGGTPSWSAFVDPGTGRLLTTEELQQEQPMDRARRMGQVDAMIAERRRATREVATFGFQPAPVAVQTSVPSAPQPTSAAARFVATPIQPRIGATRSTSTIVYGPDHNPIEGSIAGVPITTSERGLIGKVSVKTQRELERALGDPEVLSALRSAGIKNIRVEPTRGPGKPGHWTAAHDSGTLLIHPRTGEAIAQSTEPARREGGIKRVIHHEVGHATWDKVGIGKVDFEKALEEHPEVGEMVAKIVNVKPPRDAFDYDEKARRLREVYAELHAMRRYDPERFAALPERVRSSIAPEEPRPAAKPAPEPERVWDGSIDQSRVVRLSGGVVIAAFEVQESVELAESTKQVILVKGLYAPFPDRPSETVFAWRWESGADVGDWTAERATAMAGGVAFAAANNQLPPIGAKPIKAEKPAKSKESDPLAKHPLAGKTRDEQIAALDKMAGFQAASEPEQAWQKKLLAQRYKQEAALTADLHAAVAGYKRQNPYGEMPLPALYDQLRAKHSGLTVAQFQGAVLRQKQSGALRIQAFSGAPYQIERPEHVIPGAQELGYYVGPAG